MGYSGLAGVLGLGLLRVGLAGVKTVPVSVRGRLAHVGIASSEKAATKHLDAERDRVITERPELVRSIYLPFVTFNVRIFNCICRTG